MIRCVFKTSFPYFKLNAEVAKAEYYYIMNTEEIQKFLNANTIAPNKHLKISFKKRNPVYGLIVHCKDATDLQAKNFWRIVSVTNYKEWQKSRDLNLSRIFHGSEFSKLTIEQ